MGTQIKRISQLSSPPPRYHNMTTGAITIGADAYSSGSNSIAIGYNSPQLTLDQRINNLEEIVLQLSKDVKLLIEKTAMPKPDPLADL